MASNPVAAVYEQFYFFLRKVMDKPIIETLTALTWADLNDFLVDFALSGISFLVGLGLIAALFLWLTSRRK